MYIELPHEVDASGPVQWKRARDRDSMQWESITYVVRS
jgi:hypothetical protein